MTQQVIETLAQEYKDILQDNAMNYDQKVGFMTAVLGQLQLVDRWLLSQIVLYAGYIVAAAMRTAPHKPDIDEILRNLL